MAMSAKELPPDVTTDILSRLPLKTLIRFRCVSKRWLDLITYSRFPYWLLNRHSKCDRLKDCTHNQCSLILSSNKRQEVEGSGSKLYSIGGGSEEDAFKVAVGIDFPLIRGKSFKIKTSCCDGMVCLAIEDETLVLWNPSTRDYKILPLPADSRVCEGVCGLGFDLSIDDYKVVSVSEKQIHVFSVKRNVWRNAGDFPYSLFREGIPANGCLYWAAAKANTTVADRILCLDLSLSVETFREVPLPPFGRSIGGLEEDEGLMQKPKFGLLLRGKSLCAFSNYDQSLWIMEELKHKNGGEVKETWNRLMTLPRIRNQEHHHFQLPEFQIHYRLNPKCFTKNGKLAVSVQGKKFVMYDPREKCYEDLDIRGLGDGRYRKAIAYTESLISPCSIRGMNDID